MFGSILFVVVAFGCSQIFLLCQLPTAFCKLPSDGLQTSILAGLASGGWYIFILQSDNDLENVTLP
jgi:hypothetical protein